MKKTVFSLAIVALLLVAPELAKSDDVSVDFFYNNLSGGSWVEVADYGYCWQPDLAVSNANWRPYSNGYWAYTDLGWTWVSYEDFGWATYHYGRWTMLSDYGWVWVPGRDADLEWGPAWVSWRTGGEYIGWAPLPPETITVVEGRPLTGHLDIEFNIGPACYNFVDVRYIGEPVLRERIIAPTQNIIYIQQTVNVTNITYKNKTVYNYGPDINVVNRTATRPIQRLRLEREQNVDFNAAAKSGGLTRVQGDRLVVAAPMHINRSTRQVAPPAVKARVEAAKIDRGWSGVGDEKAQAQLKEKIKGQDLKNVPPTSGAGAAGQANAAASAGPATGAAAGMSAQTGQGPERGRNGRGGNDMVAASASPAATPATNASAEQSAATNEARTGAGRGQNRPGKRFPQPADQTAPAGPGSAAETAGAASGGVNNTRQGGAEQGQGRAGGGQRGQFRNQATPAPGIDTNPNAASGDANAGGNEGQGRQGQGRRMQNQPVQTAPRDAPDQGSGRRRENAQGGAGERQGGPGQGQGDGRRSGKKGQGEASPSATPQ
jgi:hypothetical protein